MYAGGMSGICFSIVMVVFPSIFFMISTFLPFEPVISIFVVIFSTVFGLEGTLYSMTGAFKFLATFPAVCAILSTFLVWTVTSVVLEVVLCGSLLDTLFEGFVTFSGTRNTPSAPSSRTVAPCFAILLSAAVIRVAGFLDLFFLQVF